jgi:predicted regulator of Ras-like GTPase activity (Roadblock/LC7/MglB family)
MVRKKRSAQEVAAVTEPIAVEAASAGSIRVSLEEIKTYEGVIGYILRNSTSVAIDLKDPTKIIDYAILSSSALDASEDLSELFNLGKIKEIIIEGKDIKVLSLFLGENKISVFMEKNADYEKILKKLHPS